MKRSKSLMICSVVLTGVLAYVVFRGQAIGQQAKPSLPTPVSLAVVTHTHGALDSVSHTHGFILWSDGTVKEKSLPGMSSRGEARRR